MPSADAVREPSKGSASRTGSRDSLSKWARRAGFYLILLLGWEGVARSGIWPPWLFPGPVTVVESLVSLAQKGLLLTASLASLQRIAIGYGISLVIGVPLGLAIGRVRVVGETLRSLVVGLQALPSVCWLPLAVPEPG